MSGIGRNRAVSTFAIFAAVIAAIHMLYVSRGIAWLAPYIPVLVAVLLIYIPVLLSRSGRDNLSYLDRTRGQWWSSVKLFLLVSIILIPPYLFLNHIWQMIIYGLNFHPRPLTRLSWVLIDQLFLVAIPEEIFFRGWLQSRLDHIYAARWRVLGVRVGWSWILTAVLFAIAHSLITYQWWHFAIFFPALVFGWMRAKTGTVMGPAFFHCLCNLTAYWVGFNYS